jgi:hypothetical protein
MLDFVLFGFGFLVFFIAVLSLGGLSKKSDPGKHDAVLTVVGDNLAAFKMSASTYEYRYDDLKGLAGKRPKDADYFGPPLKELLTSAGLVTYSGLLLYSAGSKKVQKLLAKDDVSGWIVAIEKREKPLSWKDDGPYLLYKETEKDKTKYVPRLLRIEAK